MGFFSDIEEELDEFGEEILGAYSGNTAKAAESLLNRQFQADQSSTAHQRQVADLRAAGLNPILSGVGGAGAATSAGSMANLEGAAPSVSSALEVMRTKMQIDNMKEENKNLKETNKNIQGDTQLKYWNSENFSSQASYTNQLIAKAIAETGSARSIEKMDLNDLFSSNLDNKVFSTKGEYERRMVERYGTTAKHLLPWLSNPGSGSRGRYKR